MYGWTSFPCYHACEEKFRLLKEYDYAASQFSESINTLNGKAGKIQKREYKAMQLAAEKAKLGAEAATANVS